MNAIAAIKGNLNATKNMLHMFVSDLSDADLLVRPAASANHIAWQLGHLIASECQMISKQLPNASLPPLPPGFAEKHTKETSQKDSGFLTKQEYLDLFDKVRNATIAATEKLSEADLDKPTGWEMAPNLGALLLLNGNHVVMHAGQFTVVRRKLGKPVLF